MKKLLAACLFMLFPLASTGYCQTPTPSPFNVNLESMTGSLIGPSKPKVMVIAARVTGTFTVGKSDLFCRVAGWQLPDGGSGAVSLTDPSTFSTLEFQCGGSYEVNKPLRFIAFGGSALPVNAGNLVLFEAHPITAGLGLELKLDYKHYLILAGGLHGAAGKGGKFMATGKWPLKGGSSFVFDTALGGPNSFIRYCIAFDFK